METRIVTGTTGPAEPTTPTVEEKILGKFNSQEELINAYSELEKKLGATPSTNEPQAPPAQQEPTPSLTSGQAEIEKYLTIEGLDFDTLSNEYETSGGLSGDSYDALAKAGISRQLVDAYIAGQEAIQTQETAKATAAAKELMTIAGSEEQYKQMVTWAQGALSEEEIIAFNMAVCGDNKAFASMAIRGLVESYSREIGMSSTLVKGGNNSNTNDVFNSVGEMVAAMSDPRYKNDSHYRSQVESKIIRSRLSQAIRK